MLISCVKPRFKRGSWFALILLIAASIACSADNLIGQPPNAPTPTIMPFATATLGGRVSVWLITPTGQANGVTPTVTPFGNIIAPAATATAAFATFQAATATAAVKFSAPVYQPNSCPDAGNPLPPLRPATFGEYPQAIGLYLSQGGATTTLESTLSAWGALANGHGVLQADTDVTGDGINDIILTLVDPTLFKANAPSPGQLLVYGCSQKGYRLLYSTPYTPQTMLPELKRVGNMNAGSRAQIVYIQPICSGTCTQTVQILNWNTTIGTFQPLNDLPIDATNAKVEIADVGNTGVLKVVLTYTPPDDPNAGPPRRHTEVWDWNGINYVKALIQYDAPIYRIHAAYDADFTFEQGDFRDALKQYDRVRDDQYLQPWIDPNEMSTLRAYAAYRKLLTYAALRQSRGVADTLTLLQTENPSGSPAEGWSQLASAFMDSYQKVRSLKKVCAATLTFLAARPDLLATINNYGYANHTYSAPELCPF